MDEQAVELHVPFFPLPNGFGGCVDFRLVSNGGRWKCHPGCQCGVGCVDVGLVGYREAILPNGDKPDSVSMESRKWPIWPP